MLPPDQTKASVTFILVLDNHLIADLLREKTPDTPSKMVVEASAGMSVKQYATLLMEQFIPKRHIVVTDFQLVKLVEKSLGTNEAIASDYTPAAGEIVAIYCYDRDHMLGSICVNLEVTNEQDRGVVG